MLEAKLGRSGQAPLDIYIGEEPFVKSGILHLRWIMQMIVPHVARWGTLRVENVPHKIRRVLLDQLRGKSVPYLHRVEFLQHGEHDRPFDTRIKSTCPHWNLRGVVAGLSNLRHVKWINPREDLRSFSMFSNLITLEINIGRQASYPSQLVQLVHRVLCQSPLLEYLYIYQAHSFNPFYFASPRAETVEIPVITHRSLQRLQLDNWMRSRTAVMRSLVLPRLACFGADVLHSQIHASCCETIDKLDNIPSLRVAVFCGSYSPGYPPETSSDTYMLFVPLAIPKLRNLRLSTFVDVNFGENDRWLPDFSSCCPRLKALVIARCTGYTVARIRSSEWVEETSIP